MAACKKACIHNKITTLPEQYNTVINSDFRLLSGGEMQRIALARLFLKDYQILVLDESTSSLDKNTEDEIINNIINQMKPNSIAIFITHNPSIANKMQQNYYDGKRNSSRRRESAASYR